MKNDEKCFGMTLGCYDQPMDTVRCEEVIIATIKRAGKGINGDPIRIVTQVFKKDGILIAEHDPFKNNNE